MNREAFLLLGVCMLLIAVLQGEDVFDRAAPGAPWTAGACSPRGGRQQPAADRRIWGEVDCANATTSPPSIRPMRRC